jgi:hypothetical protein
MDTRPTFYEEQIDRTPYTSFIWLALIVREIFAGAAYGLWQAATTAKAQHWFHASEADALLNTAQDATLDVAAQARDLAAQAAKDAAQKQINNAKAAATQELLQQKDAAINEVKEAAQDSLQTETKQQEEDFQKYLNQ